MGNFLRTLKVDEKNTSKHHSTHPRSLLHTDPTLRIVDFSERKWTTIPDEALSVFETNENVKLIYHASFFHNELCALNPKLCVLVDLRVLDLSFNNFRSIPMSVLLSLQHLHTLILVGNLIDEQHIFEEEKEDGSFGNRNTEHSIDSRGQEVVSGTLPLSDVSSKPVSSSKRPVSSLKTLKLGLNQFTAMPSMSVWQCHFPNLRDLLLGHNSIQELLVSSEEALFSPTLSFLALEGNQIVDIPSIFFDHMDNLTMLRLPENQLCTIPETIRKCKLLNVLDLHENRLEKLPEAIGDLIELRVLILAFNRLTSLPDSWFEEKSSIPNNPSSENFSTDENASQTNSSIETLPSNPRRFGDSIEELFLQYNKLEKLMDNCFSSFIHLRFLNLTGNKLQSLPESICCAKELSVLEIGNNCLVFLPDSITRLVKLEKLSLFDNCLTRFPKLGALTSLKILLLGYNPLTEQDLPEFPSSIEELHLGNCRLADFPASLFKSQPRLKLLFLGHNPFAKAHFPSTFEYPFQLNTLDIRHCQLELQQIPKSVIAFLHRQLQPSHYNPPIGDKSSNGNNSNSSNSNKSNTQREISKSSSISNSSNASSCKSKTANNDKSRAVDSVHVPVQTVGSDLKSFHFYSEGNPCHLELQRILSDPGTKEETEMSESEQPVRYVSSNEFPVGYSEMIGKRTEMEDTLAIIGQFGGQAKQLLVCLFDGHGGSEVAQLACNEYPEILLDMLHLETDVLQALHKSFETMNEVGKEILRQLNLYEKRVGSTAVIVLLIENRLYVANAGDSRAVLAKRNGDAIRLSLDHKPLLRSERDLIRQAGGFVMETGRVNGVLAVSRGLCDFYLHPFVSTEPYIAPPLEISPLDDFLIVACDGVWDVLSDNMAVSIVGASLKENPSDCFLAASRLRDLAYLHGSRDNISAVVIQLHKD